MDKALQQYLNYLSSNANQWGFMGQDPTQTVYTGVAAILATNGQWQFNTTVNHNYVDGDKIRLTKCNSRGFDGVYKINVPANNLIQLAARLSPSLVPFTLCNVQTHSAGERCSEPGFLQVHRTRFRVGRVHSEGQREEGRQAAPAGELSFPSGQPGR